MLTIRPQLRAFYSRKHRLNGLNGCSQVEIEHGGKRIKRHRADGLWVNQADIVDDSIDIASCDEIGQHSLSGSRIGQIQLDKLAGEARCAGARDPHHVMSRGGEAVGR